MRAFGPSRRKYGVVVLFFFMLDDVFEGVFYSLVAWGRGEF